MRVARTFARCAPGCSSVPSAPSNARSIAPTSTPVNWPARRMGETMKSTESFSRSGCTGTIITPQVRSAAWNQGASWSDTPDFRKSCGSDQRVMPSAPMTATPTLKKVLFSCARRSRLRSGSMFWSRRFTSDRSPRRVSSPASRCRWRPR